MTLDEYRLKKGWSYSELARQVGASDPTIPRRWCMSFNDTRRLIPSQLYMDRIVQMSQSEVMPNDFYMRRDG